MIESPCNKKCVLDKDGLCEGCFRTHQEIAAWPFLSNLTKRLINSDRENRKKVKPSNRST